MTFLTFMTFMTFLSFRPGMGMLGPPVSVLVGVPGPPRSLPRPSWGLPQGPQAFLGRRGRLGPRNDFYDFYDFFDFYDFYDFYDFFEFSSW